MKCDFVIKLSALIALFTLSLSCTEYEIGVAEGEYIRLESDGIGLGYGGGPSDYVCRILPEGAEFSVVPESRFDDIAFVSSVHVLERGYPGSGTESEHFEYSPEQRVINEKWGEITYNLDVTPHAILIKIYPIEENSFRNIRITIGNESVVAILSIIQESKKRPSDERG